ncbi:MAG: phage holin family protein [Phycicoccus sp.]|nr:phage holin family protein [Phycicoccus sp.]
MTNFLIKTGIGAVALWAAAYVVSGFHLADGAVDWQHKALTIVLVALLFGVVNAVLGSLARFLSFPAIVLTLGLFTFVVNAFLLQVTEWLAQPLGLDFSIDEFFWDAVFAALIVSLVSWGLDLVLPGDRSDRD